MTLDMTQPYIRGGVGLDRRKISGMGEIPDFKSILSIPGSALFLQISELTDLRDIQSKSGKVCIARTMAIVREMITLTIDIDEDRDDDSDEGDEDDTPCDDDSDDGDEERGDDIRWS